MNSWYIYQEEFFYNKILQCSKDQVETIVADKDSQYVKFRIPKKKGLRLIHALSPDSELREIQCRLNDNFLSNIPIPDYVYSFRKGFSYKHYLRQHTNFTDDRYFLRLDISNFFDSISVDLLKETFSYYFRTNDPIKNNELLDAFINIVTYLHVVPQGAITSPSVSNIIFRQLDIRIYKYCQKLGIEYSRYADDLLFSGSHQSLNKGSFIKMIFHILESKGFKLNPQKIVRSKHEITLNGFVIGNNIRLSRKRKHDIANCLFLFECGGQPISVEDYLCRLNNSKFYYRQKRFSGLFFENADSLINYLAGYRSFLIDWIEVMDSNNYSKTESLIYRIERLIKQLENLP